MPKGIYERRAADARFYAKVNLLGPLGLTWHGTQSPCHLWTGGKTPAGYGSFDRGRSHRWVLKYWTGSVPEGGLSVLHSCDVPLCVNPEHLKWGTASENVRDMITKGRQASQRGELNPRSKLTDGQRREIGQRFSDGGVRKRALAVEYGVSEMVVHKILKQHGVW